MTKIKETALLISEAQTLLKNLETKLLEVEWKVDEIDIEVEDIEGEIENNKDGLNVIKGFGEITWKAGNLMDRQMMEALTALVDKIGTARALLLIEGGL